MKNLGISKNLKKNCRVVTGKIAICATNAIPPVSRILGGKGVYNILCNHKVVKGELVSATGRDFLSKDVIEGSEQFFVGEDQVLLQELHILVEEQVEVPVSLISCLKKFKEFQNKNFEQFKEFVQSGEDCYVEQGALVFGENAKDVCLPSSVLKTFINLMNPNTNDQAVEFIKQSNFHGMFDRITVESAENYIACINEYVSVIEATVPENQCTDFACDFYGVMSVSGVTTELESVNINLDDDFFTFDDYSVAEGKSYGTYEINFADGSQKSIDYVPLISISEDIARGIEEEALALFNYDLNGKAKSLKGQTPLFAEKFPCFPAKKLVRKVQVKLDIPEGFEIGSELDLRKKYYTDYTKVKGRAVLKTLTLIPEEIGLRSAKIFNRAFDTNSKRFKSEGTGYSLIIGLNLVKAANEAIATNAEFKSATYGQINKQSAIDTLSGINESRLTAENSKNSVTKVHMADILECLLEYGHSVDEAKAALAACYSRKANVKTAAVYTFGDVLSNLGF